MVEAGSSEVTNPNVSMRYSTSILTPHLPILQNSAMFIEFENAQKSIPIGRNVKGVIKVHLGEEFDGEQLTVTLKGFERT